MTSGAEAQTVAKVIFSAQDRQQVCEEIYILGIHIVDQKCAAAKRSDPCMDKIKTQTDNRKEKS